MILDNLALEILTQGNDDYMVNSINISQSLRLSEVCETMRDISLSHSPRNLQQMLL